MLAAEVVVIGGGVIGTAITYHLAGRGLRVTLIERGDLASGASGACGGSVTMQTKKPGPVLDAARQSQQMYRTLDQELPYDLEYQEHGSVIVAETDVELAHLTSLAAAQRQAGLQVDWLEGSALGKAWPGLGPSVKAASLCPTDAEVNPLSVVFAFAEGARRHGARICTHTRVIGIRIEQGNVVAVQTDRGDIPTGTVVNAAGAYSRTVAQMAGGDLPVRPRRGVVLVTEGAPFHLPGTLFSARYLVAKRQPAADAGAAGGYERITGGLVLSQTASGNLLVGSSREFVDYDVSAPVEVIDFIAREAVRVFPVVRGIRMIRSYAGLRPYSPDGLPIVGPMPGVSGLVVATGHEGDGVALAPWTGDVVAELVESGEVPDYLEPFDPGRFIIGCS